MTSISPAKEHNEVASVAMRKTTRNEINKIQNKEGIVLIEGIINGLFGNGNSEHIV